MQLDSQHPHVAILAAALLGTILIWWIIDPKLRAASREYETHQSNYIEENEARTIDRAEA